MSPLRRWLALRTANPDSGEEMSAEVTGSLDGLQPKHARFLSAYAAVLARVAYIDREISPEESEVMVRIIERVDDISPKDARLIVAIANEGARRLGTRAGREATQLFGAFATRAQRVGLLRCLFAVAAAHEGVSGDELEEIEAIGRELGLGAAELETCRLELQREPGTV